MPNGAARLTPVAASPPRCADAFQADVLAILRHLPQRRQTLALSATYTPQARAQLHSLMRQPQEVLLCEETTSLLAVKQFYKLVQQPAAPAAAESQQQRQQQHWHGPNSGSGGSSEAPDAGGSSSPWQSLADAKFAAVQHLLATISFQQAVIFCNRKADAERLTSRLAAGGYPATYLSADRSQLERIDSLNALRDYRARVAVTTDLVARGVDLEGVNLVVNVDLPPDAATLMHRVGRAGRFGTLGLAVTLLAGPEELRRMEGQLQEVAGGEVSAVRGVPPPVGALGSSTTAAVAVAVE